MKPKYTVITQTIPEGSSWCSMGAFFYDDYEMADKKFEELRSLPKTLVVLRSYHDEIDHHFLLGKEE